MKGVYKLKCYVLMGKKKEVGNLADGSLLSIRLREQWIRYMLMVLLF